MIYRRRKVETRKSKINRLNKALDSYKTMLNNKDYEFMHKFAKEKIKEIESELKELNDIDNE